MIEGRSRFLVSCTYNSLSQWPTFKLLEITCLIGKIKFKLLFLVPISHTIHVWYIYLHLVDFYGKCRQIYHTWMVWVYRPRKSKSTKPCPLVGSGIFDPWIILQTSHFVWSWTSRVDMSHEKRSYIPLYAGWLIKVL